MSGEHQVNVKSQSELDIGGRETSVFSYADTEPVMFCLSPEENRDQKQQPTATAAASYLDILN